MNGSARPAYKHYLVCLPPFDLTDRLETRQQTPVLLLSNLCCPLHVVASRILRSFEFDGQELLGCRVQSNYIPCSSPESFLILLFRYWRPPIRFLPRDFHFFISRCFPQLFFRAKLITSFLIPECAQPANELWLGFLSYTPPPPPPPPPWSWTCSRCSRGGSGGEDEEMQKP